MKIQGREYEPVASRVARFRANNPDWTLTAELISDCEGVVLMRATILDETGRVISTGYAEEIRGAGRINQTSTIENAETSAWGRALSAAGYGTQTAVASAEEVQQARDSRRQQDDARDRVRLANAKAMFDDMDLDETRRAAVTAALATGDLEGLLSLYREAKAPMSRASQAQKASEAAKALATVAAPEPAGSPIPDDWKKQALRP